MKLRAIRSLSILPLLACASLAIPQALSQKCTLSPTTPIVVLSASGTASPGGFLPETPEGVRSRQAVPGTGFVGGRWEGGHFFYNREVSNVGERFHNTYRERVLDHGRGGASFHGRREDRHEDRADHRENLREDRPSSGSAPTRAFGM